ncbi:MAG: RNA polymerase sigma factor [Clostridia bacterium]|nr:RNA polymerase sigma factor [Clostridia bacterium]
MALGKKQVEHMSDEQIVELYWQRDERAIKQTDAKYRAFLLSVAYNIVHDAGDCEECLNDTYLDAWNTIPPARPTALQAFLATIMRRTAIDCYKTKKRQKRVSSELTVSLSEVNEFLTDRDADSQEQAMELGRMISEFLRALPERRMYIFMSRYYISRPIGEIATLLGCSQSTVHKEIAAIKRDLKAYLEKEGYVL